VKQFSIFSEHSPATADIHTSRRDAKVTDRSNTGKNGYTAGKHHPGRTDKISRFTIKFTGVQRPVPRTTEIFARPGPILNLSAATT
jgi:FlaG/FlaF family flagellin (archaellin)